MQRIIIPTVLRNDYLSALTRMTVGNGPDGLHRILSYAQSWVQRGDFTSLESGGRYLRATNALWDAGAADRQGIHLRMLAHGELEEMGDVPFHEQTNENWRQPPFLGIADVTGRI